MADEHRPVISLAEIAALLRGPLISQRWGPESTPTDETRLSQGGTGIVPPSCQSACHPRPHLSIITSVTFLATSASQIISVASELFTEAF